MINYAVGARLAVPTEPAQNLYVTELVGGLAELIDPRKEHLTALTGARQSEQWQRLQAASAGRPLRVVSSLLPLHRQIVGLAWEQTALPARLLLGKADVYHDTFFFLPLTLPRRRPRLVVTFDDLAFEKNPEHFSARSLLYFRTLARRAAHAADAVVTISEATRQDVIERYGISPGKVRTIHLALNPALAALLKAQRPPPSPLATSGEDILYVGVLHPRKNVATLIRAFKIVKERGSKARLILAGRAALQWEETYRMVRDLGLEMGRDVIHRQGLALSELAVLYRSARVAVMPSPSEGFCLPALEALAAGLPVLAAQGGALPETLGECAEYFQPFDSGELADLLSKTLSGAKAPDATAIEAQLQRFSWRGTAERTLALYRELA